jgi:membrane-associated protein
LDLVALIETVGYIGLFAIVFAESGLLIGFFLPGDSLLFTAGFLASQGFFEIAILVPLLFIAAVTGDSVGYAFGKRVGRQLFNREDSRFFRKKYLVRAEEFFEKHGGKTIVIARFVPVVRTFAPIVAGMGAMQYRRFVIYNVVGALLWAVGVTVAGYLLGNIIPHAESYLLPIVAVIIVVSTAPTAWHLYRENREFFNSLWSSSPSSTGSPFRSKKSAPSSVAGRGAWSCENGDYSADRLPRRP